MMFKSLFIGVALTTLSSVALAAPFTSNVNNDVYSGIVNGIPTANDHNDGVPDLYDGVNAVLGTSYTSNHEIDDRFVSSDEFFFGQGSHSVVLIGLTAANHNTLGFYTDLGTGSNQTDVLGPKSGFGIQGDGSFVDPFEASTANVSGPFGWYLNTIDHFTGDASTYYSEASLNTNSNGFDHMMTFSLDELNGQTLWLTENGSTFQYTFENALLIGWEDLPFANGQLGDDDYDDMMYLIDFRTVTVDEPFALLGLGLALIGFAARRRKQA